MNAGIIGIKAVGINRRFDDIEAATATIIPERFLTFFANEENKRACLGVTNIVNCGVIGIVAIGFDWIFNIETSAATIVKKHFLTFFTDEENR